MTQDLLLRLGRWVERLPMSPSVGGHPGPYEILAPIGAVGTGKVYCASDAKLGGGVAVIILPAARAQDPGHLARFEREEKVLASRNDPNIARI